MHIFLTGGSGFIGKNLIPYLLERGFRITCLLRDTSRLPTPLRSRVFVVTGDLIRLGDRAMESLAAADGVVHLAGRIRGRTYSQFDQTNHRGTLALVDAVEQSPANLRRFVQVSSLAAAGPAIPGAPLTEASPTRPLSWYGQTKLAGERVLDSASFPWTSIRPPVVYGPHDRGLLPFFQLAARHIRPLIRSGRQELSFIHVKDVCQSIWLALTRETRTRSTYYINDGQPINRLGDLTSLLAEAVGSWTVPVPIPAGLIWVVEKMLPLGQRLGLSGPWLSVDKLRELRQKAWTCDAGLITANLGFRPTMPLEQGLSETVAWYRTNGWL